MAIAQRQLPQGMVRPSPRPVPGRAAAKPADWAALKHAAIVLPVAAVLVARVWGYARMTQVNYQRVALRQERAQLEARKERLGTEIIRQRDKDAVEKWAIESGMVRPTDAPVIITQKGH